MSEKVDVFEYIVVASEHFKIPLTWYFHLLDPPRDDWGFVLRLNALFEGAVLEVLTQIQNQKEKYSASFQEALTAVLTKRQSKGKPSSPIQLGDFAHSERLCILQGIRSVPPT